jgi:hypothetical protein
MAASSENVTRTETAPAHPNLGIVTVAAPRVGIFLPFQPCPYVTLEVAIDSMPIIQQSNGEPLCL